MNSMEKLEVLKDSVYQLYSKEGRSKVYISKLLKINRKSLGIKISEWDLPEPEHVKHLTPSNQKFLNKHRNFIKSKLDKDHSVKKISELLGVTKDYLYKSIIKNDDVLLKAYKDYKNRQKKEKDDSITTLLNKSHLNYDIEDYKNEEWKDILGYEGYKISNYGRVKKYAKTYDKYFLLTPVNNKNNARLYVKLTRNKKEYNLQVSRLVAFAFVPGHTQEKNTVNHKDGNVINNYYENLEWMTQSDNNHHAYYALKRKVIKGRRYNFKKIRYKNQYEFKTVTAFSKFLNKSETETRRYLDEPDKHEIELIV